MNGFGSENASIQMKMFQEFFSLLILLMYFA